MVIQLLNTESSFAAVIVVNHHIRHYASVQIAGFMQHSGRKIAVVRQYVVETEELITFLLRKQRMSKSEFSTAKLHIHPFITY